MTIGGHVPTPPSPAKAQEEVQLGDSVFIMKKVNGAMQEVEAAVEKVSGQRVRLLAEDNETWAWADVTELIKVVKGGAEELKSRAKRLAEEREEAEQEKRRKAEEEARLKAEKEAKEAAAKAEAKRIYLAYQGRATTTLDWMPSGKYFNTDHLPIPDHQKDIFRVVWYELDLDKAYKRAKPKYAPDYKFCGGRVFYTDGEHFNPQELVGLGSTDGAIKGDGPCKTLVNDLEDEWTIKELEIKEAFDGGMTLKKYDAFPPEDTSEWVEMETDMFKGWVRKSEVDLADGWWQW